VVRQRVAVVLFDDEEAGKVHCRRVRYTTDRTVYWRVGRRGWVGRVLVSGWANKCSVERAAEAGLPACRRWQELSEGWRFVSAAEAPSEAGTKHMVVDCRIRPRAWISNSIRCSTILR